VNLLQLAKPSIDYGLSAYRQLRFIKSFLKPIVDRHCAALDYPLSDKEKKKVDFYYPLFNQIVNCENYLCIKGRGLTLAERQRLAIISAMATLYDDLIDEEDWDKAQYFHILHRTLPEAQQTPKVKLIFALDDELRNYWQPTQQYLDALHLAIDWQVESSRQLHNNISLEEILHISEEKCGNSSLLWASIMDEAWTPADEQFIYQSGFVGQIVNDVFDAFKDREDGIYTIVRKAPSISELRSVFINECARLHQYVLACDAPRNRCINTIRRMACIHAFALIAIDHLQNTENKYGVPMDWQQPLRKELVTDMAFFSNKIKIPRYACWLAKIR